jgi:cell division protein FtsI/penicillin-binding protein 2
MSAVSVDQELWTNVQTALAYAVIANGGVLTLTDWQLQNPEKVELTTERTNGECVIRAKLEKSL